MRKVSIDEMRSVAAKLAEKIKASGESFTGVFAIPRGGYLPAILVSEKLGIPVVLERGKNILIIDDVCDGGSTLKAYSGAKTAVLFCKEETTHIPTFYGESFNEWLVFPDEKDETIQDNIRRILTFIGENPSRDGLRGTPDRVEKAMRELFRGYDPKQAPKITVFENGKDGITFDNMVVDSGNFYSFCEHHILPFFGTYHFAYIPNPKGKILGISKVARVVDYCAARLQIQERLGKDICDMIRDALGDEYPPLGIAIILKGEHLCKSMRGVKKRGEMQSSHLSGVFQTNADARREFLSFVNN